MTRVVIDPPPPWAPLAEWRRFLEEARRLDQDDPNVRSAIRSAEAVIREAE